MWYAQAYKGHNRPLMKIRKCYVTSAAFLLTYWCKYKYFFCKLKKQMPNENKMFEILLDSGDVGLLNILFSHAIKLKNIIELESHSQTDSSTEAISKRSILSWIVGYFLNNLKPRK